LHFEKSQVNMADVFSEDWDVVILGTGLVESILAA
jgi:RAB protein geranylgeranyltransferase component A